MEKTIELVKIMTNRKAIEKVGTIFKIGFKVYETCGRKGKVNFITCDGDMMSVKDFGNKKAYLFNFTIFGKKVKDSFYYEDCEIVSEIEVEEKVEAVVAEAKA